MQSPLGRGQPMVRTGCQYTFHARVRVAAREGACWQGKMWQDHKRSKNSTVAKGPTLEDSAGGAGTKTTPGGARGANGEPRTARGSPLCVILTTF